MTASDGSVACVVGVVVCPRHPTTERLFNINRRSVFQWANGGKLRQLRQLRQVNHEAGAQDTVARHEAPVVMRNRGRVIPRHTYGLSSLTHEHDCVMDPDWIPRLCRNI